MDVSIVLINYNTRELTIDCIKSVIEKSNNFSYEIIVIDNQSSDDSVKAIKALNNPNVIVFENNDNEGTARAFNKGAKMAKGKYVFWLNTDTLLINNAIYELYNFMENNPDAGVIGGNLYDANKNPTLSYKKELMTLRYEKKEKSFFYQLLSKKRKRPNQKSFNYKNTPTEVAHISGADMMIRASLFSEIGYFNDNIFMYAEETDFEYRMLKSTSYKSYNVPSSKIIHLEGMSFDKNTELNEFKFKQTCLGECKFFYYNYGKKEAIKFLKIYRSLFKKTAFFARLVFKKNVYIKNMRKIELLNSYILDFDNYINSFK